MKRIVLAGLMVGAALSPALANQTTYGRCRIEVDGTAYVNGRCGREIIDMGQNGRTIIMGENRRPSFFVSMHAEPDQPSTFDAHWSGSERNYHADDDLG